MAADLRRVRERAGLTQRALADRLGITRAHVSNVERVRRIPKLWLAKAWMRECGAALRVVEFPGDDRVADALTNTLTVLGDDTADLEMVIRAWPHLSGPARVAIMAVIGSLEL